MDETNGRRETHDFMNVNVESFSQLPFIRRAPVKEKGAIRLFGKDFGAGDITTAAQEDSDSSETTTTTTTNNITKNSEKNEENHNKDNNSSNSNSSSTSRRFECHYCFRNFPTSQALGGHQNAHKRERQHAKRGATYLHHHNQPDTTHVYGFLNHNNYYHHHNHQRHYLGGSYGGAPSARLYGGQTSSFYARSSATPPTPPTINGSPLGLWRVPPSSNAVHGVYASKTAFGAPEYSSSSNHSTLPLLATEHEANTGAPSPQNRTYWYGLKGNVQDHVSLDLHL